MAPDANEDSAPRDSGVNPSSQFDQNPSGGSGDYSARGDYGSAKYKMDRGDREAFERRGFMIEGERRGSMDRMRMDREGEGPYGSHRGLYDSKRFDSRERQFGYGRERQYGYGRMGRADSGSPGRSGYASDFDRYGYRRDFGGRSGYGGDSGRSDYGSSRYGYSRGGYGDYSGGYSHDGGSGRGYGYGGGSGYGDGYGSGYGSRMGTYGDGGGYGSGYGSRMQGPGGRYEDKSKYSYSGYDRGQGDSSYRGQGGYSRYGRDYGRQGRSPREGGYYGYGSYNREQSPYSYEKYGSEADKTSDSLASYGQSQRSYGPYDSYMYNRGRPGFNKDGQGSDYKRGHFDSSPRQSSYGYSSFYSSPYHYGGNMIEHDQSRGGNRPYPSRGYPFDSSRFLGDGRNRFGGYGGQHGYGNSQGYRGGQYGYGTHQHDYDGDRSRYGNYYKREPLFKPRQFGSFSGNRFGVPPPFPPFPQSRSPCPSPFNQSF